MKFKDIKIKSDSELKTMAQELQAKLIQLRFEAGAGKLKNVDQIGKVKRDIARLNTALRQISK